MNRKLTSGVACLLTFLSIGCVEKSKSLTAAQRSRLGALLNDKAPADIQQAIKVNFEGRVELLGYTVHPSPLTPGARLKITWHWHCIHALEEGWRLFTHIADADGNERQNIDDVGPIRELYPPSRWKAGEYIDDTQEFSLPADWNSTSAIFHVGLWNGPHRMTIESGPNDGSNRARVATIPVERSAQTQPERSTNGAIPQLDSQRTTTAPQIDGKMDEALWKRARSSRRFVNTRTGGLAEFRVTAKTLWDERHFYVGIQVQDDFIQSTYQNLDDHLWEQDAVEVMIDPSGRGHNYFELQVSPTGVVFDTRYDSRRHPRPFGHVTWHSDVEAAVDIEGIANDREKDRGYTVEMAIPWSAFRAGSPPFARPQAGQQWRVNFYVMDARPEGQRAAGWSAPMVGDFHKPDRFGRIRFVDRAEEAGPAAGARKTTSLPQLNSNLAKRLERPHRLKGKLHADRIQERGATRTAAQ
ncbi:MAG: carbohydrate-binding family 9-like protein [Myxococcota bacterium]